MIDPRSLVRAFASIRLTLVLMGMAILLVLAGTIAQVDQDLNTVQQAYFRSWLVYVDFWHVWLPGGYTLGLGMFVALIAATLKRPPRRTPYYAGVLLTHGAVAMFLASELATGLFALETTMEITEGETAHYSFTFGDSELVVIDPSQRDHDRVVAAPASMLRAGEPIAHTLLPFKVVVRRYLPSSTLVRASDANAIAVTGGIGTLWAAVEAERGASGPALPSAYVDLVGPGGVLGTYLVSVLANDLQPVVVDGKTWQLGLRFRRYYKDFSLTLKDFAHDRYTGTNVAKNFSSRLQLVDPGQSVDREVLISMNQPLRHGGEAFYQSAYKNNETTTVLQVVRNPSWTVPYLAMGVGAIGMLLYFGQALGHAVRRARASEVRS